MEFATRPCRQGTASGGACVEEPKYPRAMRALAAGHAIPEQPQRSQGAGSPKKWQPMTPAMAAGMTDSVWTMEALLRSRVPCDFHARLDP